MCTSKQHKLCGRLECNTCFIRSFATYDGKTSNGKLKVECWDNEKNGTIEPRSVTKGNDKKCWFKCDDDDCNHSFNSTISHIINGTWCPYCANKKICNNDNCNYCYNKSFASYDGKTPNGKLKVECWDNEKNETIKPRTVSKYNNKKYWFKCDDCNHSFNSTISNITNGTWCPICKNKTEKKFLHWFKKTYKEFKIKHQPKYNWCKSENTNRKLPFDFVIEKLKLIIEIDGRQHFEQVSNWSSPEFQLENDIYKMKKALENGYSILRIIQEDIYYNKNNWEKNIKDTIKSYDEPNIICIGCDTLYINYNNIC